MKYTANPVAVEAHEIVDVSDMDNKGSVHLALRNGENKIALKEMTSRYRPVAGDYWVIQEDGYVYLNPKDVFERKYRLAE